MNGKCSTFCHKLNKLKPMMLAFNLHMNGNRCVRDLQNFNLNKSEAVIHSTLFPMPCTATKNNYACEVFPRHEKYNAFSQSKLAQRMLMFGWLALFLVMANELNFHFCWICVICITLRIITCIEKTIRLNFNLKWFSNLLVFLV